MIVQNVATDGLTDISFTLSGADLARAEKTLAPVLADLGDQVAMRTQSGIAKLSVVGIGMRSHSAVASRMFSALAEQGINIQMISPPPKSRWPSSLKRSRSSVRRGPYTRPSAWTLKPRPDA